MKPNAVCPLAHLCREVYITHKLHSFIHFPCMCSAVSLRILRRSSTYTSYTPLPTRSEDGPRHRREGHHGLSDRERTPQAQRAGRGARCLRCRTCHDRLPGLSGELARRDVVGGHLPDPGHGRLRPGLDVELLRLSDLPAQVWLICRCPLRSADPDPMSNSAKQSCAVSSSQQCQQS